MIPDDVAMKLQHLLWLYGMTDTEVPRLVGEYTDHEDDERDDDEKMEHRMKSPSPMPSPPSPAPASSPVRGICKSTTSSTKGKWKQLTHRHLPLTTRKSKSRSRRHIKVKANELSKDEQEGESVFGPKATADEVSAWFRSTGG